MTNDVSICRSQNASTVGISIKSIKTNKYLNLHSTECCKRRSEVNSFISCVLFKSSDELSFALISAKCIPYSKCICLESLFDCSISTVIYIPEINFIFYSVRVDKSCSFVQVLIFLKYFGKLVSRQVDVLQLPVNLVKTVFNCEQFLSGKTRAECNC